MTENYVHILALAQEDVEVLQQKGKTYGSSWRRRGGVGAFMMMARKWDRIENITQTGFNYDIFAALTENQGDILDDIQDLRRYLLLIESFITAPLTGVGQVAQPVPTPIVPGDPDQWVNPIGAGYDGHD